MVLCRICVGAVRSSASWATSSRSTRTWAGLPTRCQGVSRSMPARSHCENVPTPERDGAFARANLTTSRKMIETGKIFVSLRL